MKATIFNVERFSTEDGPGIRTVVFLKGCTLRCKWCANPESQAFRPEVLFHANACVGCGKCVEICPQGAVSYREGFGYITDPSKCDLCGECIRGCFAGARTMAGTEYTVESLMEVLLRDEAYYHESGGGITFSGGEPLLHSQFIKECAKQLHARNISVLVETCGMVPKENMMDAAGFADIIYFDFKHHDPEQHRLYTGADNRLILENLMWLDDHFKGFLSVRYPYIPDHNSSDHEIEQFIKLIQSMKHVAEVWFLPYHRLGLPKYQGLGRVYEMGEMKSLKMKDIAYLTDYEKVCGIPVRI